MSIKCDFVTVRSLIEWTAIFPGEEVCFTGDVPEGNVLEKEPTQWYGAMCGGLFDVPYFAIGCWGSEISVIISGLDMSKRNMMNAFIKYFKKEFGREITEDSLICIERRM